MNEFWTKEKLGKHPQLAAEAERLYKQYAMCDADKLLKRLKESRFKFGNFGPISYNNLLLKANLDDCLQPEYVDAALKVTTAQPAIGKGEFLFASLFDNVGFAKQHGDLVDLTTKKMAEVKGVASSLSNGYSKNYIQLNNNTLINVFRHFKLTPPSKLDAQACKTLSDHIADERSLYYVLEAFRNTAIAKRPVIESAMSNYMNRTKKNLLLTIAAMQLYEYLHTEQASYFLAVNNDKFMCFDTPNTVYQAAEILTNFSIDDWTIGNRGFKITLK